MSGTHFKLSAHDHVRKQREEGHVQTEGGGVCHQKRICPRLDPGLPRLQIVRNKCLLFKLVSLRQSVVEV